ncbi:HPr family phosphocarrier protein [Halomonas sp. FeN2]|uniref:HPr family phosphocarrier protein n=1 Tax=Vreelandella neptunia TaxID=115551 RepID=A0ABZ0YQD8_9GAMM|nr:MULTISPECIES: HPr family phosphocarrier protein [Halomonas]TDV99264.1 phosphocarrier protein NPr [Halomonas alkaliantarctica]MBF57375.1 HPr family phosphocarrier protein [Halomonas sp.]MBL1266800.1 HPr family phosphocarrier protein [Halomonas sp.]MDN3559384.1 HPr family phosphocarrier protein [Halomonas neptunia]UBR49554.1 HPr family phosphocarrier protein [Halomonas sp. FeN2]
MPERILTLTNQRGLHARAATKLVKCGQQFTAKICVYKQQQAADAANIMSLLMLAAPCGTELRITAEGDDAEQALEAIQALFDARFEEDQ